MGIGFTGGLDQSDILSDGTPFDGANIDAPISSAGQGVDWADKTPRFDRNGDTIGTLVSVSGAGYILHAVFSPTSDDGSAVEPVLSIDGTNILGGSGGRMDIGDGAIRYYQSERQSSDSGNQHIFGPLRFDSSFTMDNNSNFKLNGEVSYALD